MAVLQRMDFNSLKKKYTKNGKSTVRLTESSLVLIQNIQPNKTVYNFPVLENEGGASQPEEIRLNINDEFIVNKVGIYLGATMFDGTLPVPLSANFWFTYAPFEMSNLNVANNALYDGFMRIAVNNINFVDKWDIKKHEERNQTQMQNFSVGMPFATAPQDIYKNSGVVEMTPNVTLSGAKKNEVTLVLPKSLILAPAFPLLTVAGAVTFSINKVIICKRGFLAQNASAFQG